MTLALWSVGEQHTPQRLAQRHEFLERQLEDWIWDDPGLVMPGLEWVARQLIIPGLKPDLLGLTPEGKFVVGELKQGPVNVATLLQALHYVLALSAYDTEALCRRPAQWKDAGRDRLLADSPESGEWPYVLVLVGTSRDPDLDQAMAFLERHGLDLEVRVVTFTPFLSPSGEVFLAREVEELEPAAETGSRYSTSRASSIEGVVAKATAFGCDDVFHEALAMAERLALPVRPWPRSVTVGVRGNARRTLLYLRPDDGGVVFGYSTENLELMGFHPDTVVAALGENWFLADKATLRTKLAAFEKLLTAAAGPLNED